MKDDEIKTILVTKRKHHSNDGKWRKCYYYYQNKERKSANINTDEKTVKSVRFYRTDTPLHTPPKFIRVHRNEGQRRFFSPHTTEAHPPRWCITSNDAVQILGNCTLFDGIKPESTDPRVPSNWKSRRLASRKVRWARWRYPLGHPELVRSNQERE